MTIPHLRGQSKRHFQPLSVPHQEKAAEHSQNQCIAAQAQQLQACYFLNFEYTTIAIANSRKRMMAPMMSLLVVIRRDMDASTWPTQAAAQHQARAPHARGTSRCIPPTRGNTHWAPRLEQVSTVRLLNKISVHLPRARDVIVSAVKRVARMLDCLALPVQVCEDAYAQLLGEHTVEGCGTVNIQSSSFDINQVQGAKSTS